MKSPMKILHYGRAFDRLTVFGAVLTLGVLLVSPAYASAPVNDDFDNPTLVTTLPFAGDVDFTEATRAADDPIGSGPCAIAFPKTVWYAITPAADLHVYIDYPNATVWTGSRGSLSEVACFGFFGGDVPLAAGQTYYIMLGVWGDTATLGIRELPLANDEMTGATTITGLPFSDSFPIYAATAAPDDPVPSCLGYPATYSVWYRFTPATDTRVFVEGGGAIATYTAGLTEIACTTGSAGALGLGAGQTYFFMSTSSTFGIQEAPPLPTLDVTVDRFGAVDSRTGVATISGTLRCTGTTGDVLLFGHLSQLFANRVTIAGDGYGTAACSDSRWSMTVSAANGRFAGGLAEVELFGQAFNALGESAEPHVHASIRLKSGSK